MENTLLNLYSLHLLIQCEWNVSVCRHAERVAIEKHLRKSSNSYTESQDELRASVLGRLGKWIKCELKPAPAQLKEAVLTPCIMLVTMSTAGQPILGQQGKQQCEKRPKEALLAQAPARPQVQHLQLFDWPSVPSQWGLPVLLHLWRRPSGVAWSVWVARNHVSLGFKSHVDSKFYSWLVSFCWGLDKFTADGITRKCQVNLKGTGYMSTLVVCSFNRESLI